MAIVAILGVAVALRPPAHPGATPGWTLSSTASDGPFTLTIEAERATYAASEVIRVQASLTYAGPDAIVTISHGYTAPPLFGIAEPVNGLDLQPLTDASCGRSTLERGVASTKPFRKSGGFDGGDPRASDWQRFYSEPELRLPAGTWHIYALAVFSVGPGCGSDVHDIRAEIAVRVDDPAAAGKGSPATSSSSGDLGTALETSCGHAGLQLRQCGGFVATAIEQAGVDPGTVSAVSLDRVDCPGGTACPTRSTGMLIDVRISTADGATRTRTVSCVRQDGSLGGINLLCSQLQTSDGRTIGYPFIHSPIDGYFDTPCTAAGPDGCATPLPSVHPDALANAAPLAIDSLDVPIDHAGQYSVLLGEARLPNGILSAASVDVTSSPVDPIVSWAGYTLKVRSLDGGAPFDNLYRHGWQQGVERVEIRLEFVVLAFDPGAVVTLSNVDVH